MRKKPLTLTAIIAVSLPVAAGVTEVATLEADNDAAAVNWGGDWRKPTQAQLQELSDYCTWEWKEEDWDGNGSLAGYLLTSNANGKKLFLPAAGSRWDSDLYDVGSDGYYWPTELYSSLYDIARYLSFHSGHWSVGNNYNRSNGFSVRRSAVPQSSGQKHLELST